MNVLIATDSPQTRSSLIGLLNRQNGVMTHTCADAHTLQNQVRAAQPDLVLLDWELSARPPAALLFSLDRITRGPARYGDANQWMYNRWPTVIVLSERSEVRAVALACGASAFVHKPEAHVTLGATISSLLPTLQ